MTGSAFQASLQALETVGSFFFIGLLGYHLIGRKWFSDDSAEMLSNLVTKIVLPANLLYYINTSTTREQFLPMMRYILIPVASIALALAAGWIAAKALRLGRSRRSVFITAFACSNTINIGLPINLALFGPESIPAILIYYMGNTILFWTVGNYLLATDGDGGGRAAPFFSWVTVRRMFPPAIIAFLAGMALMIADIRLPMVLGSAFRQVGSMTTALSIMCIGITIRQTGLGNLRLDRDLAVLGAGRFVVSPLLLAGMLYFMPVDGMMRNVFIVQSSLPPMSSIILLTIAYKTDSKFAAVAISLLTIAALVTIPVTRWVLAL